MDSVSLPQNWYFLTFLYTTSIYKASLSAPPQYKLSSVSLPFHNQTDYDKTVRMFSCFVRVLKDSYFMITVRFPAGNDNRMELAK